MNVYLAGPMRGYDNLNAAEFRRAAGLIRAAGHYVFNPAEHTLPEGEDTFAHYMAVDLAQVCKSDAVAVLDGWQNSQGARMEVEVARELGIPVLWAATLDPVDPEPPVHADTTDNGTIRKFATGATRDTGADKLDFEGFFSPQVMESFARYMHKHRLQADGALRDSDNWQKGIPRDVYMKSLWRHFFDVWCLHRGIDRGGVTMEEALNALRFNVNGYQHELLKEAQ